MREGIFDCCALPYSLAAPPIVTVSHMQCNNINNKERQSYNHDRQN